MSLLICRQNVDKKVYRLFVLNSTTEDGIIGQSNDIGDRNDSSPSKHDPDEERQGFQRGQDL
jgi:hypothetical protein